METQVMRALPIEMIAKLICWWKGHRRGRRVPPLRVGTATTLFQCPRCHATWSRRTKAKAIHVD